MAVTQPTNRWEYVASAGQTQFPYTRKIFFNTDLVVFKNAVQLTITTDYTVDGVGNVNGGNVNLVVGAAAGDDILILGIVLVDQQTVYPTNDKFPAKVHEDIVDRLTMICQQLTEVDKRTVKMAITSLFKDLTFPDPVSNKILRWKSDLSGMENTDVVGQGAIVLPIGESDGGTGEAAYTQGDLLVGDVGGGLSKLVKGAANRILQAGASTLSWVTRAAALGLTTKGDLAVHDGTDVVRQAVGANRTILEADSTQAGGVAWGARALGLKSIQVFTAGGTWTRPAGIRRVVVEVVGGGGGGGGSDTTSRISGGGGGGAYAMKLIDVTAIASATISVGAGGAKAASTAAAGSGAGHSEWADGTNTVTANGGGGGPNDNVNDAFAAGGTATGGDLNLQGEPGGQAGALGTDERQTRGGSSARGMGAGANAGPENAGGRAGQLYGGGGSGAWAGASGQVGGDGAAGIVIVWEYE